MRAIASALPLLLAAASLAGCASAAASPLPSSWAAPYSAAPEVSLEAATWTAPPALAVIAPPVQDAPSKEFDRTGLYIGAYGIQSFEDFDTSGTNVDTGDSDLGVGLKLGFRLGRFLAVEAVAENVTGFEIEAGTVSSDLDLTAYGLQGKFFLLGGRFQPYGLAGFGITSADVDTFDLDEDGGYVRLGLGLDVYITSNFAAFGEVNYNKGTGSTDDITHTDLQLGVLFRF